MDVIKDIIAREVLDSRGWPTVQAKVVLSSGLSGVAMVPSGASTGSAEALELRDQDSRYNGKGVLQATRQIHEQIKPLLLQQVVHQQEQIDQILIDLKTHHPQLGANASLAVSLACNAAAALALNIPLYQNIRLQAKYRLPMPMINIINGGAHANNNLDIQEFMIIPQGAPTFREAMRYGAEVFHALKKNLNVRGYSTAVGDEGGFAPQLRSNREAIELILQAIQTAGFKEGVDLSLGLDVASSEFFASNHYTLKSENKRFTTLEWIDYLADLSGAYPITSIEDGMAENDWVGWQQLTERLGSKLQIVGDDVFVTNTEFLKKGIGLGVGNAILIKPNQIGTLSQTLAAIDMAQSAGYNTIISHRSGETEDTFIADLAVSTNAGQIKTGSMCRSERIAKYNRLLNIESDLGHQAVFAK